MKYDVISGVSVGAINSCALGLWEVGQEKKMADYVEYMWRTMQNEKLWKMHDSSDPYAEFNKPGFMSNEPLHKLLLHQLEKFGGIKRRVIVSALDLFTGGFKVMKLHEMDSYEEITRAVMGSAAVPFVFPPQDMRPFGRDTLLLDGASTWSINYMSAIEECYTIPGISDQS